MKKLRRIAMRNEDIQREKRWKAREIADMLFGVWMLFVFVGCPVIFVLGVLGVIQ